MLGHEHDVHQYSDAPKKNFGRISRDIAPVGRIAVDRIYQILRQGQRSSRYVQKDIVNAPAHS